MSAPPPSSARDGTPSSARHLADGAEVLAPAGLVRNTAPSPGVLPPPGQEPPSIFLIATWLAEREFERALQAVQELGSSGSPELSLLETRALLGLGRKAAARRSLERLCRAPLIDPDLRAAAARLLIELGDAERAREQARRAHAEDPDSELARLTLSWALARSERWALSPRSRSEISELLSPVKPDACPMPALAHALRALTLLSASPDAAHKTSDAALLRDPQCVDALAVAAVLAHVHGREVDVRRWVGQLLIVDHHAAEELAATLETLGDFSRAPAQAAEDSKRGAHLMPPRPTPREAPAELEGESHLPLWDDKEMRLVRGDARPALFEFEQMLARKLERLGRRPSPAELAEAASITARHLTEAAVSRYFAPFDLSVFSIARLDAALALLYGGSVGPRTELRSRALLGLGAYAGECLRQAYAGEWMTAGAEALTWHIEAQGLCFSPFEEVDARLQLRRPLEVDDAPRHPGAEPLGHRAPVDIAPPVPWDPRPWPEVTELPRLAATLRLSPIGVYCESVELPLHLSFASLRSIDRYVTLLSPQLAPPDPQGTWLRGASVLMGAYVGEVLRRTCGGRWESSRTELSVDAYALKLASGVIAYPVRAAFDRLAGRNLEQLSDYAGRLKA